jgi:hypothetical protein
VFILIEKLMLLDDASMRAWCFTAPDDDELNVFEDALFNQRVP